MISNSSISCNYTIGTNPHIFANNNSEDFGRIDYLYCQSIRENFDQYNLDNKKNQSMMENLFTLKNKIAELFKTNKSGETTNLKKEKEDLKNY